MGGTPTTAVRNALGFFSGRLAPDYGVGSARSGLIEYLNVPTLLGMIVSGGAATLAELQSIYGLEDAYNLSEIIMVDAHNRQVKPARGRN